MAQTNKSSISLHIQGGLHNGASFRLKEGDILLLGQADDADIILQDLGVAAHQALLHCLGGVLSIRVLASGISLKKRPKQPGETLLLTESATVELLQFSLYFLFTKAAETDATLLNLPQEIIPYERTRYSWPTRLGMTLICFVLMLAAANFVHSGLKRVKPPGEKSNNFIADEEKARAEQGERLSKSVQEVLRLSGIKVEARYLGDGDVEIDGQFMEKQQIDQVLASRSIREVKGLKRVFVKGLPTKREGIGLEIQAIVNGSDPFVLSADGTHYYPGARLANGFQLKSIGKESAVFEKPDGTFTTWELSGGEEATENGKGIFVEDQSSTAR